MNMQLASDLFKTNIRQETWEKLLTIHNLTSIILMSIWVSDVKMESQVEIPDYFPGTRHQKKSKIQKGSS